MRLSVDAVAWPGLLAAALMLPDMVVVQCAFPLGESILERSYTAVQLSALAYETNLTQYQTENSTWSHPDYDEITFYTEEPDQAILAAVDNRCFVAFRGTNADLADCECGWKGTREREGIVAIRRFSSLTDRCSIVISAREQGDKTSTWAASIFSRTTIRVFRPVRLGRALPILSLLPWQPKPSKI